MVLVLIFSFAAGVVIRVRIEPEGVARSSGKVDDVPVSVLAVVDTGGEMKACVSSSSSTVDALDDGVVAAEAAVVLAFVIVVAVAMDGSFVVDVIRGVLVVVDVGVIVVVVVDRAVNKGFNSFANVCNGDAWTVDEEEELVTLGEVLLLPVKLAFLLLVPLLSRLLLLPLR